MSHTRQGWIIAGFGAVALAALYSGPAHGGPRPRSLIFPVVVGQRTSPTTLEARDEQTIYSQAIRSTGAVRTLQDFSFSYRPVVLDRRRLNGGERTVSIPKGALFVLALDQDGELYCAAAADRPESGLTFFDVGVCLRDEDRDGVFDRQLLVQPTSRVRTAYEILIDDSAAWSDVRAPYERVVAAAIPALELRVRFQWPEPRGWLKTKQEPGLGLALCASGALTNPNRKDADAEVCGVMDWKLTPPQPRLIYGAVPLKSGTATDVEWGPVRLTVAARDEATADVTVRGSLEPGPGLLGMTGSLRSTGDYRYQTSIFAVIRSIPRPAPAPASLPVSQ